MHKTRLMQSRPGTEAFLLQAGDLQQNRIEGAKQATIEFTTGTINPLSRKIFIFKATEEPIDNAIDWVKGWWQ